MPYPSEWDIRLPPKHQARTEHLQNWFRGLSSVNIPVQCNVKVFIWLRVCRYSWLLYSQHSVGSRKRGPVCPEPRLLSSTEHSAGFKGECSLGSQVLISPQTDPRCQKRWDYLSLLILMTFTWHHEQRMYTTHCSPALYTSYHPVREPTQVCGMRETLHEWKWRCNYTSELRLAGQTMFISTFISSCERVLHVHTGGTTLRVKCLARGHVREWRVCVIHLPLIISQHVVRCKSAALPAITLFCGQRSRIQMCYWNDKTAYLKRRITQQSKSPAVKVFTE